MKRERYTEAIRVRLPPDMHARVVALADRLHRAPAVLARDLMLLGLEAEEERRALRSAAGVGGSTQNAVHSGHGGT